MFLFKRNHGIYYIRYKDFNNKWKSVSTKTKKQTEAKQIFFEFIKSYSPRKSLNRKTNFVEFAREYIEYSKVNHSPSNTTRINYVINHFKNYIGSKPLLAINNRDIESYKSFRLNSCNATTFNIELRAIKSMFTTAVDWDIIDRNPLKGIQLLRVVKVYPNYLSKEEVDKLIEKSKFKWLKDIILFAFHTYSITYASSRKHFRNWLFRNFGGR